MAFLTVLVVLTIVVLGLALARRDRASSLLVPGTMVVYVILAAMALSALVWPGLYRTAADLTLQAMGVQTQIRDLDDALPLNDLVDASGKLLEVADQLSLGSTSLLDLAGALLRSGQEGNGASGTADDSGTDAAVVAPPPSRILENSIYPGLVAVVAAVFRVGSLVVSLAGMVAVVALGYSASVVRDRAAARNTLRDLELRVAALEARRVLDAGELVEADMPAG